MRFLTPIQNYLRQLSAAGKPLRMKMALAAGITCGLVLGAMFWNHLQPTAAPTALPSLPSVGIEALQSIVLNQPTYAVAKPSEGTPLRVKIKAVEPVGDGTFLYKLSFTGLEKGVFNLTDFLVSPTGDRLKEPISTVTIGSAIPSSASFNAIPQTPPPQANTFPYRLAVILSMLAWAGWGAFLFWPAKKQTPTQAASKEEPGTNPSTEEPIPTAHTLADLLRPLVEKAADKSISAAEKADLERILFEYWGRDLELDHLNSVEQLRRILEHPEAGALLRTIEQWLYQPDSAISQEEINAALESYLGIPSSEMPQAPSHKALPEASHKNAPTIIAA